MAVHGQQHRIGELTEGAGEQMFLVDALFCQEEHGWEDEGDVEEDALGGRSSPFPLLVLKQDLLWEDEELRSLFSKEEAQREHGSVSSCPAPEGRSEVVEWFLKASAHYGFSALTVILAIDYVDRFLLRFVVKNDKPWMIQLLAVACLSLAAKVEETSIPLLLDFQVGDAKYVFDGKAIQRMELLVLSTLRWKMHPVTPLSFLDHIIRRLGLRSDAHWEFFRRCEAILLALVCDSRSVGYLRSVLATAAMLHAIEDVEICDAIEHKAQLLGALRMTEEKVGGCYQLVLELSMAHITPRTITKSNKRNHDREQGCSPPSSISECHTSGDCSSSSYEDHGHLHLQPPLVKRSRTTVQTLEQEQHVVQQRPYLICPRAGEPTKDDI
ncbi:hypothetical protein SAY86_019829 [Trapa natans]|uniref:Cyclin N-terminal domain-containing protein n=1 Tax=Trapa natans TaxID=22666 RepID=A0AAN7R519_TRANT|nr:hypothetical protein SAY86_019829 [Trapa natans]